MRFAMRRPAPLNHPAGRTPCMPRPCMIDCPYMGRRYTASWRTTFAFGLCLLAFVFAVEAKTAWYGPAAGPGSAVRAAKALPADMPRVIEHGIPVPDPIHPQMPFALLAALSMLSLPMDRPLRNAASRGDFRFFPAAISPQVFFRPPPALS